MDNCVYGMKYKGHFVIIREFTNESKSMFTYRLWHLLHEGPEYLDYSKNNIQSKITQSRCVAYSHQLGCKY